MSTINEAINRLKTRHKEYLQSEYHIRHDRLIQERMDMLEDAKGRTNVMADPFWRHRQNTIPTKPNLRI